MAKLHPKEAHNRVKNFLTDLIELGEYLIVRDDGKIVWADSIDKDILLKPNKNAQAKTLYVYSIDNQDPNGILLNPINETTIPCEDHRWFYQTTNKLLQIVFSNVLNAIIDVSLKAKKDVSELKEPGLAHLLSPFVNDVDEKMKDEVELITSYDYNDKLIYIQYNKKTKTCGLYTLFQDPEKEFINSFKNKIRKKFWTLLEKIFQEIFSKEEINTDSPVYEYKIEKQIRCPKFRSYTDVLVYAWKMLLPFYTLVFTEDISDKNVDRVQQSLKNLEDFDDFSEICLWANSGAYIDIKSDRLKAVPRTDTDVPWEEPEKEQKKTPTPLELLGYKNRFNNIGILNNNDNVPGWKKSLGLMNQPMNDYRPNAFGNSYNNYNNYNNPLNNNCLNNNCFVIRGRV